MTASTLSLTCGTTDPSGVYELRTVKGERLPMRASSHPLGEAHIVGGSVTLNSDGSYQHRIVFRVRDDTLTYADSAVERGRYVSRGAAVDLQTRTGDLRAVIVGDTLAYDLHGWRYEYARRR